MTSGPGDRSTLIEEAGKVEEEGRANEPCFNQRIEWPQRRLLSNSARYNRRECDTLTAGGLGWYLVSPAAHQQPRHDVGARAESLRVSIEVLMRFVAA